MTPLALTPATWHGYGWFDIALLGICAIGLIAGAGLLVYTLTRNRSELP